ncbi:hypothetical protein Tco_0495851 [Tanacetum coccineum]
MLGIQIWKMTDNHPPLPPIVRNMIGRPRKERIKAPSENNSQVSRVARGHGRGSRGGRGGIGGRNGSGRGVRGGRNGSANIGPQLMAEEEIRVNLEHDYMQDLFDAEEYKREHEDREYQERLDEEAFQEAMEQQRINEQMDEERERHNREEREWEEMNDYFNPSNWTKEDTMDVDSYNMKNSSINFNVFTQKFVINDPTHPTDPIDAASAQDRYKEKVDVTISLKDKKKGKDVQEGEVNVAARSKDKQKGKDVQEGSKSESVAQPLRKSKRLRHEDP